MAASSARVAETRSERLIEELLAAQGWDLRRPPQGHLLAQQEYKDYPELRDALASCSKTGGGAGIPEYILLDRESREPLAVFEAKAQASDLPKAIREAERYGSAFRTAGYSPLAVAVAGTRDDRFAVRVLKPSGTDWKPLTYDSHPIQWIPNPEQLERMRPAKGKFELRPTVPSAEVLKTKAEEINRLLRESGLKDDFRPAAIGAIMLALWKSRGDLRRDPAYLLTDVNAACEKAFWDAKKPDLAKSLRVDVANRKLSIHARRICAILERLNITTLTAEHDYIGALYEEFFRYTGGNTIGQYFTPRHITRLMTDLCDVGKDDVVLDPACGTGGFLIAAMQRMQGESQLSREQIVKVIKDRLLGIEDEPVTAALCVANMILRGDGTTGIARADTFETASFPTGKADVVLMNPPFPHEKTDTPPEKFVSRALEGLKRRGLAAVIVPSSLLVKKGAKAKWREEVLEDNTLLGVISLPSELFQPYASATTAVLLFRKGVRHTPSHRTFFCRVQNDGLRLKKGVRVPQSGSQVDQVLAEYRRLRNVPEFCAASTLDEESGWAPGAYIETRPLTDEEYREEIGEILRNKTAFVVRFAPRINRMQAALKAGELNAKPYKRPGGSPERGQQKIADLFHTSYGQKALHSKENLGPGEALVISSSGTDNGCYGFFDFSDLIAAPFVTVPSTGSIGEAAVQELPCGVVDDCLILIPRKGTPPEAMYVAAATLRRERWRFDYGRKITPSRIGGFPVRLNETLRRWIGAECQKARDIERRALDAYP